MLALVSQGVVQSFAPYRSVALVEPLTIQVPATVAAGMPLVYGAEQVGNPLLGPRVDRTPEYLGKKIMASLVLPREVPSPGSPPAPNSFSSCLSRGSHLNCRGTTGLRRGWVRWRMVSPRKSTMMFSRSCATVSRSRAWTPSAPSREPTSTPRGARACGT